MKNWLFFSLLCLSGCAIDKPALEIDASELNQYWFAQGSSLLFKSDDLLAPTEDGYVSLRYTITAQGEISNVSIVESAPFGLWDTFALRAVEQLNYKPSTKNQSKQAVIVTTTFRFTAKESK